MLQVVGSYSWMEKYSSHLVSYAVAGDAYAPRATVADEPGAAWEDVERAGALHSTGTPCPVQGRANSPYQQLVPGNAAAVADLAVPSVAGEETEEGVVVAAVADTLATVAQLVTVALSRVVVPARIASRSSPAEQVVPVLVVAGVVVDLRFPLCSLYASILYFRYLLL